ncbi:hypothetical protein CIB48_g11158 [Xylaria polymorpha]|nr:hypothetical protein CIB48_g11158 [Xylaria polymorpha]
MNGNENEGQDGKDPGVVEEQGERSEPKSEKESLPTINTDREGSGRTVVDEDEERTEPKDEKESLPSTQAT